jgi:hypothetical protein
MRRILAGGWLLVIGGLLAGCGGQGAQPTIDVNAAVQTALAQTRVIEAQVAQSVQETLAAVAPGATSSADTSTSTPVVVVDTPTSELPAATAAPTAAPPTASLPPPPTNTPPPPPTAAPTPTKLLIAESDVDGDDGNDFLRSSSNSNQGRVVLLPGFSQADVTDVPVFRDFINLRVEVFDTRAGLTDGAGIQSVTYRVVDDEGNGIVFWEKRENNAAYCLFGGDEPLCAPLVFTQTRRWPDPFGAAIQNGRYVAEIDIAPQNGDATQWRWRFEIDSPYLGGATPAPSPNTARINGIIVEGGRYVVDFETFGFTPQLPGQHVHFFFDTVPPSQAGMPGSGPWQLYPAAPGQPNTSPFTLLTVQDRPAAATQMCILVANPDHSVIQNTGNCVYLP